jgi:hypothetical protein
VIVPGGDRADLRRQRRQAASSAGAAPIVVLSPI